MIWGMNQASNGVEGYQAGARHERALRHLGKSDLSTLVCGSILGVQGGPVNGR